MDLDFGVTSIGTQCINQKSSGLATCELFPVNTILHHGPKTPPYDFLNNVVKNKLILITFGKRNPEKQFTRGYKLVHSINVATVPLELQKVIFSATNRLEHWQLQLHEFSEHEIIAFTFFD